MKKASIIILTLCISINVYSQTKIIAYKSHSGSITNFQDEKDGNFGISPQQMIDSVIKISDSAVVEISRFGFRDTVYHPHYLSKPGISLEEIKSFYPERAKLIGFEKQPNIKEGSGELLSPKEKKGSISILTFLLLLLFMYKIQGITFKI